MRALKIESRKQNLDKFPQRDKGELQLLLLHAAGMNQEAGIKGSNPPRHSLVSKKLMATITA